jgi:rhodanese-related sulfurtransferase
MERATRAGEEQTGMFGFGVKTITITQLAERLRHGTPVLLDVREPSEFAAGHVPGAWNAPLSRLADGSARLDRNAQTLIICQSGRRSVTAAKQLKRFGFTDVYSVRGGTGAWSGKLSR